MTYSEIISLIDSKDRKGWESLFLMYGRKFYGFALNNWGFDEDSAWEVVYQTLQTIILKIGEYEIQSQVHFDNLLFKIFINYLRQYYRKTKKTDDVTIISLSDLEVAASNETEENTVESELKNPFTKEFFSDYLENDETENPKLKQLELALEKLEPQEKDLLLLKANGFTYDQIAEMLKIANNQLKVKHHRAKNKLIKLLQAL